MVAVIKTEAQCLELFTKAHEAGNAAVAALNVRPMIVTQHADPLNDSSAVERAWYVADGVCGFAWVVIKPANSKFSKWLIGRRMARVSSEGGVRMWISDFNQSYQKKSAYADAFAKVLSDAGIRCYSDSRLD
jgi:hypothetical protein